MQPWHTARRGKVFAALDAENLLHMVRDTNLETFTFAVRQLVWQVQLAGAGSATVVCDRRLARRLALAPIPATWRVFPGACGQDRADRELNRRLLTDVPTRARRVIIGSGDHLFATAAAYHRSQGREVVVLASRGTVSADLYLAATDHIELPTLTLPDLPPPELHDGQLVGRGQPV